MLTGLLTPALATGAALGGVVALSVNTWTPLHLNVPAVSLACAAGVLAVTQGAPGWATKRSTRAFLVSQRGSYPVGNTSSYTSPMSKVMVSLPDGLLAELDAEVKRRGTSRSALLADAARRELARRDPAGLAAAIKRSERRFRGAGSFESADVVRVDRDDRR